MAKHWYITAAAVLSLALAATAQQTPPAGATAAKVPAALSQELVINVWDSAPEGTDKTEATANNQQPTMTAYLPDPAKSNGTAVIVCPGGAFRALSMQDEGSTVAKSLNDHGIIAFVLKYHLYGQGGSPAAGRAGGPGGPGGPAAAGGARGRGAGMGALPRDLEIKNANANPEPNNAELANVVRLATLDGSQAIRVVRQNAANWKINPNKIGIMGFSAGGGVAVGSVLVGDAESKPNFVATCYGPALVDVNVPADAPPLFIAVAADHQPVANGLIALYQVWKAAGKSAEMHIYSNGRAGFGMRKQGLTSDTWIDNYYGWMKVQGFTQ